MEIYISGKITGNDNYKEEFEKKAQELRALYPDAEIINPVDLGAELPEDTEWSDYMRADIRALTFCDTIYMMDGYESSRGAKLELRIAKELGFRRIYE